MKTATVAISDGELHYLDSQGQGATVILLHGNSSSATAFTPQLAALGSKYRLLAVDLLGHGGASQARRPEQSYSFAGYALSLIELVEQLDLREFFLVGHSLGGHAAIEALPGLHGARGLVLVGAPPFNQDSGGDTFHPEPTGGLVFQAALADAEVTRLAKAFIQAERLPASALEQVSAFIRATDPQVRGCLGASLGGGGFADELAILHKAQLPVLLAQGRQDAFINADYCASESAFAGCDLRVELFDDCGHCPHVEHPERFNALLDAFISQTLGSSL